MRKSTSMALAVFAVLMAASIYTMTRKPERGITRLTFTSLDANAVDKIEVAGQTPVVLAKKDGVWRVPNGRAADKGAVDALLGAMRHIHSDDVVTQDANRFTEFEVDAEKGRDVSLYVGSQKLAEVVVGKFVPGQTNTTAMRTGNTVYKVKDVLPYVFGRTVSDWTERHVTNDAVTDISRFNVRLKGNAPFTMAAMEKGWEVLPDKTQPEGYRFDASAGQTLVSAATNLQAQELLDNDPGVAVTKLDADADTLTWFFKDSVTANTNVISRTLTLGASRDDKQVYAKVEGRDGIFTLSETTANGLRRSLNDLRDLTMMNVDPTQVVSVVINDGKTKVAFERANGTSEWKLTQGKAPPGFTLDPSKVMKRIQMTAHVRATGMAPAGQTDSTTGVKAAKASVTLTLADKTKAAIVFGNKAADGFYGQGNIDKQVYVVGNYMHDQLLGGVDTFKRLPGESDPFAQLDPSALNNLPPEVRASLQQQIAKKQREQQMLQQLQNQAR